MRAQANIERTIRNDRLEPVIVTVEPWGMPIELNPSETLELRVTAPRGASIEIDSTPNTETVWAPPGATIEVVKSGALVYWSDVPVPEVPEGMSTRSFLGMVLNSDGSTEDEGG